MNGKKHLDCNGYAPSLLPSTGCYLCKRSGDLVRHEVFFGPNRAKSKALGLWVTLCPACHTLGPDAVHNNAAVNLKLKQEAQRIAMEHYCWTVEEFMAEFGKSWI